MTKFENVNTRIKDALAEDGAFHDVTTRQIPGFKTQKVAARIIAKEAGVYCGGVLLLPVFRQLDPQVKVVQKVKEGAKVKAGTTVALLKGNPRALLGGERVFLNLASRLSGIATATWAFVNQSKGSQVTICDTRKTLPLWRDLDRYAVRCGGGKNHRDSLKEAILIKDNHLALLRKNKETLSRVYGNIIRDPRKRKKLQFVELEAQSYKDVWEGIKIRADIIMLDNMSLDQIKGSIELIKAARRALNSPEPLIEVSGDMTLDKMKRLVKLGVDRISVGAITHSAPSLDLSLEVV